MNRKQIIAPTDDEMYKKFSRPGDTGRGVWYLLMLKAAHSTSNTDRLSICNDLRLFCDWFGCGECRGHCKDYTTKNPPENHIKSEKELFNYIVTFMNAVNHRLGKPGYDKNYLFAMVTVKEFKPCEKDCGNKNAVSTPKRQEPSVTPSQTPGRNIRTLYLHN